ncbi:MAG: methionine--tRNA ligase [Deltaproteobacteria bacterium]|nr:methionine--tRNA ligase [Deltaproteobacteria bacterium]
MDTFYVTTPIYYVNDVPHIGHAYTTIVADVLARYHRARGRRVFFLTGTDEHGQKIERAAEAAGLSPAAFVEQVMARFRRAWQVLNISNDDFLRTTEPRHRKVVEQLWQRMADKGDIYRGEYDGLYCVGCEEYYTESQAEGARCPTHRTPLERLKQSSYFFRMSRYQDALLDHFEKHPTFVQPDIRRNEILSFVRGGLRDLSISRTSFRWGIPVPGDPEHVIYVWIDALTNYLSGLGGFDGAERYRDFWPADLHLMGKDILRFHAVYWPCMLLSAGVPLPKQVFAHGWWTINGQKMSKSLRNVVDPEMLCEDVGRDALRYFLVRETPLGNDGDFSHAALLQRINAELANDLGNLLNRSVAMVHRYWEGKVPPLAQDLRAEAVDRELVELAARVGEEAARAYEGNAPSRALDAIWELVRAANKYVDVTAPYSLIKDPAKKGRVGEVLANFLESLRWTALLVAPVMPDKAQELLAQLGLDAASSAAWPERWGGLAAGQPLPPPIPLFPRIDDDRKAALLGRWQQAATPAQETTKVTDPKPDTSAEGPALLTYDEFSRLDLRVGKVLEAQRVQGADRLLQLRVDLGSEVRQIVAGIAETYAPEALVGRQVIVVANLKPAKIRGVESRGMILAAGEKQVLALSALDVEVPPGTKVR